MLNIPIIYQDNEIFIINKPAGLAVQGGQGVSHSLDVDFPSQVGQKVFLVHRLDKDTCGLMIVAKNPQSAAKWTKLIGSKICKKEYIAVCAGTLKPEKGKIKEDLVQHGQVKSAVTDYIVEKQWTMPVSDENLKELNFSRVRLLLETGRMHQIRIHLAKQNCPIAGDDQHGNFKINKLLRKDFKVKKLMLSCVKLTLPLNGVEKSFEIESADHMKLLDNQGDF